MAKPLYCFCKYKDTDLEELDRQIKMYKSAGFDIAIFNFCYASDEGLDEALLQIIMNHIDD